MVALFRQWVMATDSLLRVFDAYRMCRCVKIKQDGM